MKTKQQARIYAAKIHYDIAKHAFNDDFGFASHVTHDDKVKYVERHLNLAKEIEEGNQDHNFTVWQRMNEFLTGECVALLPK